MALTSPSAWRLVQGVSGPRAAWCAAASRRMQAAALHTSPSTADEGSRNSSRGGDEFGGRQRRRRRRQDDDGRLDAAATQPDAAAADIGNTYLRYNTQFKIDEDRVYEFGHLGSIRRRLTFEHRKLLAKQRLDRAEELRAAGGQLPPLEEQMAARLREMTDVAAAVQAGRR